MPCKNAGIFLDECISSIINQSYKHWELLVCNDRSSDNSQHVIEKWSALDKRIKIFENNGIGIIDALCTGYKYASGAFITRMDADDKMPSQKLETLLNLLKDSPANRVATGKVKYFPKSEIRDGYKAYESWLNSLVDTNSHWQEIYKECVIASPCWMMEKESFENIGGFAKGTYPEDYDLVWRMFTNHIKVISSTKVLHLWRDHPQRTSRNSDVYQTQTYFELKINYMLSLPSFKNKNITVWGAGKKGKSLVALLQKKGVKPFWVCNNPNKIGHTIFGVKLHSFEHLKCNDNNIAILISVSAHQEQQEVQEFLNSKQYQKSIDYFVLA